MPENLQKKVLYFVRTLMEVNIYSRQRMSSIHKDPSEQISLWLLTSVRPTLRLMSMLKSLWKEHIVGCKGVWINFIKQNPNTVTNKVFSLLFKAAPIKI